MNIEAFQSEIGINFKDKSLLEKAVTHTSYAYEHGVESYEKLEYLGDAILEFIISEYLFKNYSHLSEGEMTKVRAGVVCEESLYEVATRHNFGSYLNLGKSEIATGGNKNQAILADCVEAVIAATFLDQGIETAKDFIIKNLNGTVENCTKNVGKKDYKTLLQEKLQVHGNIHIEYKTIKEEGPDHDKKFTVELFVNGRAETVGEGPTKKAAEMMAAKKALDKNGRS